MISFRAFTLIEMLVYLGLFSLLLTGAVISAYGVAASAESNQIEATMEFEGRWILHSIERTLTDASVITTSASTIQLMTQSDEAVTYHLLDGHISRTGDDGVHPLSSISVRDFLIARTGSPHDPEEPERFSIRFTLSVPGLERTFEGSFYPDAP